MVRFVGVSAVLADPRFRYVENSTVVCHGSSCFCPGSVFLCVFEKLDDLLVLFLNRLVGHCNQKDVTEGGNKKSKIAHPISS